MTDHAGSRPAGPRRQRRLLPGVLGGLLPAVLLAAPLSARATDCVLDAAKFHRVNPTVLLAIAVVESRIRPDALHKNANGTHDVGVMQINSIHMPELARHGVKQEDLFNGCKNVYMGAWILRKQLDKYGNTWAAIGAYHSATPALRDRYAARVRATVSKLIDLGYAYPGDKLR